MIIIQMIRFIPKLCRPFSFVECCRYLVWIFERRTRFSRDRRVDNRQPTWNSTVSPSHGCTLPICSACCISHSSTSHIWRCFDRNPVMKCHYYYQYNVFIISLAVNLMSYGPLTMLTMSVFFPSLSTSRSALIITARSLRTRFSTLPPAAFE